MTLMSTLRVLSLSLSGALSGEGRERGKREKQQCARDTLISYLPHEPQPELEMEPANKVLALDQESNPRPSSVRGEGAEKEHVLTSKICQPGQDS